MAKVKINIVAYLDAPKAYMTDPAGYKLAVEEVEAEARAIGATIVRINNMILIWADRIIEHSNALPLMKLDKLFDKVGAEVLEMGTYIDGNNWARHVLGDRVLNNRHGKENTLCLR